MSTLGMSRHLVSLILLVLVLIGSVYNEEQDMLTEYKVASQCYRLDGMTYLSLFCGFRRTVEISHALHGAHKTPRLDCMPMEGDCSVPALLDHDWSACHAKRHCVIALQPKTAPKCGDRETLGYVEIHYKCIPDPPTTIPPPTTTTTTTSTTSTTAAPVPSTHSTRRAYTPTNIVQPGPNAIDICTNNTYTFSNVDITSPGYPGTLVGSQNCRCDVIGLPGHHMTITIQRVSLGMYKGLCHDWLKLDFPGYPGNKLVTCGNQKHSEKNLQFMKTHLGLQFHTARGTHPEGLKGFHVQIKTPSPAVINMTCYQYSYDPTMNGNRVHKVLAPTDLSSLPRESPLTANHRSNSTVSGVWSVHENVSTSTSVVLLLLPWGLLHHLQHLFYATLS